MSNYSHEKQEYTFLVQIKDEEGIVNSITWISGSLDAGQSISPAIPWTPVTSGKYIATAFAWKSIENPTSLMPSISTIIDVTDDVSSTKFTNKTTFPYLDQSIPVSCTTKLDQEDKTYLVRYNIDNAKITDMQMHPYILEIFVHPSDNGSLYLELPRGLNDSLRGSDLQDEIFFVLHDGNEVEYKELQTTSEYRLLKIDFASDVEKISIVGTVPLPITDQINTCE